MNSPRVVVRSDDLLPPYEQIRRQIAALITSGKVSPGDKLPSLRQLAKDLDVAIGTVARAYRDLEQEGWVESRRGKGTRVARTRPKAASPPSPDLLERLARDYLTAVVAAGFDAEEALSALSAIQAENGRG
ncbi:GntR family transcriptional regulator [Rhodococcus sp. NPDC049939]|uniref:GntR family transcriptional regulator n=1 Tax=Rhodococcus sp. NPDC049939 TaxID=3155511 RepID=UPI00340981C6